MKDIIKKHLDEHINLVNSVYDFNIEKLIFLSEIIWAAIENGNKIILFGNGGSASDAQHIAAEFVGRFVEERKALPAISLNTDTSAITAIANDYGFNFIFERQIQALAKTGDVMIGISTSGKSLNVINGIASGKKIGCYAVTFTGKNGGVLKDISDLNINIDSLSTARIQEIHILIGHLLCFLIDEKIRLGS